MPNDKMEDKEKEKRIIIRNIYLFLGFSGSET